MSLLIAMTGFADEWTLVTDASDLQAGDQIVIAYADTEHDVYVTATTSIKKTSSAAFMETVNATFSADYTQLTAIGSNTAVFTLGGSAGAWTLTNQNGDKLGATAAKKLAWNSGTTTWTISIVGEATIKSTGTDLGQIQYNYNNNSPRFCNYKGTMKDVLIFRQGSAVPQVTIHYQGFPYRKTHCDDPVFKAGTEYTISSFIPVVNGKRFVAWNFEGEEFAPGATITVPEKDVLFIPVWHDETGISNNETRVNATKQIRNGQLIIVRDGVEYDVMGVKLQ